MPGDEKNKTTIISTTRFLVVEADPTIGEGLKRFLLSENAPSAILAQAPLLALRILQDRRTPIDCVICSHKPASFSGVEFLQYLRAGRWGGASQQHLKFILVMESRDERAIEVADGASVTGYIFGQLTKENVRKSILKALDPEERAKAAPNFKVAQMRASEADLIVAPFPSSFARLSLEKQQRALQAVALAAQKARLSGGVAAIFPIENGQTSFLAAPAYQRFLSRLTVEAANKLLNQAIYVDWVDGDPTLDADAPDTAPAPDEASPAPLPLFEEDGSDRRRSSLAAKKPFRRGLTDEDIRAVGLAFKEMGAEEFVQKFVRHQAISLQAQSQSMTTMMREHYVSIELLRSAFFPDAEMRGSARSFQSLTHLLDQLMLRSLPFLSENETPHSLNLNVHSILTKTFEAALKNSRADLLTFEIPQPMITSHFEEFKKARELIFAHGAKIAVDQIFPDTIGLLNLDEVGPHIAKLHWKGDLKNFSASHRDFVKSAIDRGVTMVMSRVDDPAAFEIAQEFGIQTFQGFLIDEMTGETSNGRLPLM